MILTPEFLSKYPDAPEHMNELGMFVFYRTYSRWLPHQKRRETWKEAVTRAVEYNVSIAFKQFNKNDYPLNKEQYNKIRIEGETLFDNIFNLRQFLSGRTHWVGGAESGVADKFPLANFNCAFIEMTKWEDLCDLFYLLLVGTGVGFRCSKKNASKFPPIRTDFTLSHSPFNPVEPDERLEKTIINDMGNGYVKIYVGDSKEGWVSALRFFYMFLISEDWEDVKHIKISYNSIRPKGERLKTFGGTASGHEPLRDMFDGFEKVLKGKMDENLEPLAEVCSNSDCYEENCEDCPDNIWRQIRPVHILDMGNLIGNNVVVGGVRRTAEIFLGDHDDEEIIPAKNNLPPHLYHRFMSNNSIAFETKPTREELNRIFTSIQINGEPGFINMEAAKKRRPNAKGLNPCGEVILDSYGVCNLTTVNVMAFVQPICFHDGTLDHYQLDFSGLMQAQALSARAGMRMTCLDLELEHWDVVQKRDTLIGCSLTGWKDAMEVLEYDEDNEKNLLTMLNDMVHAETVRYTHILRIPTPLLCTTVKPEGTLSQVAGGVSSGLHISYAPYYIRRIRINASDPLVDVVRKLHWRIQPEVGSTWDNATTLVIDFPVKSASTKTRAEQTVQEQLDTYFSFQEDYTTHNSSNTITVKEDEWALAEQIVWDRWDEIIGITFLAFDGGGYELAPYEEITEKEYDALKAQMLPFNAELLNESEAAAEELLTTNDCEAGVCAVR